MVEFGKYEQLKQIAADEKLPNQRELEDLKEIFAAEIDSVRKSECIKSVADLIACLERRDALSESQIEPLRELADFCGGRRLQEALGNYKAITPAEPANQNQYREQRLSEQLRRQLNINGTAATRSTEAPTTTPTTPYSVALTEKKKIAIYKVLAQEIGHYWRRLGRELEVGEGAMDELEVQFPREVSSRVYRLLQMFEEDEVHDPKQRVLLLCRALERCQRKDLRRKVESIMSH